MNNKKIIEAIAGYNYVFVFALLCALAAGLITWQMGERYSVSLGVTVSRLGTQSASDYKYDNYYALKASNEFGDTVAGWFKTPEMTAAVYKKADLTLGGAGLSSLARRFNASKISPNVVDIRFGASTEAEGQALAQAIADVLQEKTNQLNSISSQGIAFAAMTGEAVMVENANALWWNTLAGLLIGLVVGFFIKAAKDYFK